MYVYNIHIYVYTHIHISISLSISLSLYIYMCIIYIYIYICIDFKPAAILPGHARRTSARAPGGVSHENCLWEIAALL